MSRAALGDWRWYLGCDEDDDEMGDYGPRSSAIEAGLQEYRPGQCFWIVEARMRLADERAMGAGKIDTAPFAETRNGTWITVGPDGQPIEGENEQ